MKAYFGLLLVACLVAAVFGQGASQASNGARAAALAAALSRGGSSGSGGMGGMGGVGMMAMLGGGLDMNSLLQMQMCTAMNIPSYFCMMQAFN